MGPIQTSVVMTRGVVVAKGNLVVKDKKLNYVNFTNH